MWLIQQETAQRMQQAVQYGIKPSAAQIEKFSARAEGWGADSVLTTEGNQAEIQIVGVLTKAPDIMAYIFGGGNTVYSDVIAALAQADDDSDVEEISMYFDSPGGQVSGLFDVLAAMQQTKKPINARVSLAASAAFSMAAQADNIEATRRASVFGSIGIMVQIHTSEDVVSITSTNAPKKAPDPRTADGLAAIREELDEMHQLFVESIADGRGTTVEDVNTNYGQGATLLADKALARGMIDKIADTPMRVVSSNESQTVANSDTSTKEPAMDKDELRAKHPQLFAQVMQLGADAERDRVSAHLTMGDSSGDMETAKKAIEDGSEMTAGLQAKYMSAAMRRSDTAARAGDDDAAAAALDGAEGATAQDTAAQDKAAAANIFGLAAGDVLPDDLGA